jgi:hypothetical protein
MPPLIEVVAVEKLRPGTFGAINDMRSLPGYRFRFVDPGFPRAHPGG